MSGDLAPLVLFAYKRERHLAATLDALMASPLFARTPIYVFVDGPRMPRDEPAVAAVRKLLADRGTPNMEIAAADTNRGLAASVIAGVGAIVERFGRVIVLEDDLIVQPSFLAWMNAGLDRYADDERIFQIGGYQYLVPEFANRREGMFAPFATSWGWATWARAWRGFDPLALGWERLQAEPDLRRAFDQGGCYPFADMLAAQMAGEIDSWAIRWYWTVFSNRGLALLPPKSLVRNIGFDAAATHNTVGILKRLVAPPQPDLWRGDVPPLCPAVAELDPAAYEAFKGGLRRTGAMRNHRIKRLLRSVLP